MEGDLCSVCLVVGGDLVYGGADYHPECANYWVNWAEMGHVKGQWDGWVTLGVF